MKKIKEEWDKLNIDGDEWLTLEEMQVGPVLPHTTPHQRATPRTHAPTPPRPRALCHAPER